MFTHGYRYTLPTEGDEKFPGEYLTVMKTDEINFETRTEISEKIGNTTLDTSILLVFPSGIYKLEYLMNIVCIEQVYVKSEIYCNRQLYVIYRYLLENIQIMRLSSRALKAICFQIFLYHKDIIQTPFERTALNCRETILGRRLNIDNIAEQVYRVNLEAGVPKNCVIFKSLNPIQGISVPGTGFGSTVENTKFSTGSTFKFSREPKTPEKIEPNFFCIDRNEKSPIKPNQHGALFPYKIERIFSSFPNDSSDKMNRPFNL